MTACRCLSIAFATVAASVGGSPGHRVPPSVPTVTVTAHDFAFEAPDTIAAGPTTLRFVSRGRRNHVLQLEKISGGHSTADFARAFNAHQPMSWTTNAGGVGTVSPGTEAAVTIDLPAGSYVFVCDIPDSDGTPHSMKGMIRALTVVDRGTHAVMPTPDIVMDLTDYSFALSKPLTAGPHVVNVRNKGTQSHMALVWRLLRGRFVADVTRYMDGGPGTEPATLMGGVSDLDPGLSAELLLDLAPGRYVLICLDDDIHDQKPHYDHGMVREIVIGGNETQR